METGYLIIREGQDIFYKVTTEEGNDEIGLKYGVDKIVTLTCDLELEDLYSNQIEKLTELLDIPVGSEIKTTLDLTNDNHLEAYNFLFGTKYDVSIFRSMIEDYLFELKGC